MGSPTLTRLQRYARANHAGVAELADAPGLGPGPFGGGGSSPFARTKQLLSCNNAFLSVLVH